MRSANLTSYEKQILHSLHTSRPKRLYKSPYAARINSRLIRSSARHICRQRWRAAAPFWARALHACAGWRFTGRSCGLAELEQYWHDRLTYPTGRFDPAWVRAAAAQHARMASGVPAGQHLKLDLANPNALSTTNFTALGPQPERMTGCSGCFDYTTTEGRVNT